MAKRRRAAQRGAEQRPPAAASQGRVPERANARSARRPLEARAATRERGLLGGGADPWRVGIVAAALIGIVALVVAVFAGSGGSGRYTCGRLLAPGGTAEDGQVTADLGRAHVLPGTALSYLFCPPTSGSHYQTEAGVSPARPGFYAPDADVGPGNWVHNLEHGYAVALYRCADGVCPSEEVLADIRRFVDNGPQTAVAQRCGLRAKVIAARFDEMSTPFAVLTWDRALLMETFDVDEATAFAQRWMESAVAPEASLC